LSWIIFTIVFVIACFVGTLAFCEWFVGRSARVPAGDDRVPAAGKK